MKVCLKCGLKRAMVCGIIVILIDLMTEIEEIVEDKNVKSLSDLQSVNKLFT